MVMIWKTVVEDNGIGFSENNQSDGIGLQTIRKQINSFDGTLTIKSEPNEGTSLLIDWPKFLRKRS